ncbi:hypothetical protein KTQ81_21715 [Salmonella enterica subsp. diarizonae]|uniref:hypothetical protein n=1 Tax=Salmonella enterica TaxID=28901 RepID=UPI001CF3A7EF|nr:hypothetical protein [Salmonella enterica subsp. diarizonae]
MFNVKRNGASVEITDIPQSIPFSVFKDIADETGATETLICYFKDKSEYEVTIQQTNENMASAVGWLVLKSRESATGGVDISAVDEHGKESEAAKLEFKDLPHEIQLEAARTLRERLVSSSGDVSENIGRNLGKMFISLYLSEGGAFYKPTARQ